MAYIYWKPIVFHVERGEAGIAWNIRSEPINTVDGLRESPWAYNDAVLHPLDTDLGIIRKIIDCFYSLKEEIALMYTHILTFKSHRALSVLHVRQVLE
jgi:hypothetical protein